MKSSGVRRPWRTAGAALIAGTVLLASGCSHGAKPSSWQGGGSKPGSSTGGSPSPVPTQSTVAVVSPKADATGVVAVTPIKYTSEDPDNATVKVTDAHGGDVEGTLDKDAKT